MKVAFVFIIISYYIFNVYIIYSNKIMNLNKHLLFSYGSNSISQLRARIENPTLNALPAKAIDWQRIFCVKANPAWSGAAASIYPMKDCISFGSVIMISDDELMKLDQYEGGYHKTELNVVVLNNNQWEHNKAIAYIANDPIWTVYPSESYLTAIYVHLREQFHNEFETIDICGIFANDPNKIHLIDTWNYPGLSQLSISALCVEINTKRNKKWIMPKSILEVKKDLNIMNIKSLSQLSTWILNNDKVMNQSNNDDDIKFKQLEYIDEEFINITKDLLELN